MESAWTLLEMARQWTAPKSVRSVHHRHVCKLTRWLVQQESRVVLVIVTVTLNVQPTGLVVDAESQCELCEVPGVPTDQDAGAHLQDT